MNVYKYELLHLKETSQGFLEMNAGFDRKTLTMHEKSFELVCNKLINPLLHNVVKWSDTLFKVCLTILQN